MAIGNPISAGSLNAQLGDISSTFKQAADLQNKLWALLTNPTTSGNTQAQIVAFLQANGISATDAPTFYTIASLLNTMAGVWYGTANQPTNNNFDLGTAVARAGN